MESPTKQYLRKKVKILQQRINRRDSKIKTFKGLLANIRKNVPGSDEIASILEEQNSGFSLNLLLHDHKSKLLGKNGIRYTDTMKDFSKTLYFYSSKKTFYAISSINVKKLVIFYSV